MKLKYSFALLAAAAITALAQSAPQIDPAARQHSKTASTHQAPQQASDEGARVFHQNCSRCHNTPDGFSPSISATVLRHMRVRASLSQHQEEVLLRFLNP